MTVDVFGQITEDRVMSTELLLQASRLRTRWSTNRVARLGFLVGQGWDAKRVARDPAIASTPNNVHRQAQRFGLAFRDVVGLRLPAEVTLRLDAAASKRGLTRDGLSAPDRRRRRRPATCSTCPGR